jgi:hypothetical protein
MPGYPIAWDRKDNDGKTISDVCPYSAEEIREYLYSCHYHWSLKEDPMEFGEPRFLCERRDARRLMWIWQCGDPLGRKWWVVIGSGRSPLGDQVWRWMYAQTDEAYETCEAYLDHAWRDIEKHLVD